RKGRDCTGKSGACGRLAGAADAELELHLVKARPYLLHRSSDLRRVRLEGARPEIERLRLELDLGRIGRGVLRALLGHPRSDRQLPAWFASDAVQKKTILEMAYHGPKNGAGRE